MNARDLTMQMIHKLPDIMTRYESKLSEELKKEIETSFNIYRTTQGTPSDTSNFLNSLEFSLTKMTDDKIRFKFYKIMTPCSLALLSESLAAQKLTSITQPQIQAYVRDDQEEKIQIFNAKPQKQFDTLSKASRFSKFSAATNASAITHARNQKTAEELFSYQERRQVLQDLGKKRRILLEECGKLQTATNANLLGQFSLYLMFRRNVDPTLIIQYFMEKNASELAKISSNPFDKLLKLDKRMAAESQNDVKDLEESMRTKIEQNIFLFMPNLSRSYNLNVDDILKTDLTNSTDATNTPRI